MAVIRRDVRGLLYASASSETEVALVTFTHPETSEIVRLSSHWGDRLTDDPRTYGTRSNGVNYLYSIASITLQDDKRGSPPEMSVVIENVASEYGELLRSFRTPARVDVSIVLAEAPDYPVMTVEDMRLTRSVVTDQTITLTISKETYLKEPLGHSISKWNSPGLYTTETA